MSDGWTYPDADNVRLGSGEELARRHPCPTCTAPPEAYCVTRTGHTTDAHRTRGATVTDQPTTPAVSAPPPAAVDEVSLLHLKGREPRLADDHAEPVEAPERPPTDPALRKAWEKQRASTAALPGDGTPASADAPTLPQKPSLGRIVLFRSKTGRWTAPAIVTAVTESLFQPNVDAGHLHPLSSDTHVHLTVFTPGIQGHVSEETAREHPELADPNRPNLPAGGSFQEFDVGQWSRLDDDREPFEHEHQPAGTWMWPPRVEPGSITP